MIVLFFVFKLYGYHLDLHVLTHSFPTRRSSDLQGHQGASDMKADNVLATIGNTPHIRLSRLFPDHEVWVKSKRANPGGSIKDRIALAMVEDAEQRSEEHTSELQSLMRISYAVFCLKQKKNITHESSSEEH